MIDNDPGDSRPVSTRAKRVPWRAILICLIRGSVIAILGSFLIALWARLNVYVLPAVPWYLVATAITCLTIARHSTFKRSGAAPRWSSTSRAAWVSAAIAIALGLAAVAITGLQNVVAGMARLPGDAVPGTELFQTMVSLAALAGAAVVEEASVRGQVQSRLQGYMTSTGAEIASDVLLVLLHFLRLADPGEALFVILLSIAGGRIAALTQTTRWPMLVHLGANLIVGCVVLAFRA